MQMLLMIKDIYNPVKIITKGSYILVYNQEVPGSNPRESGVWI